MNELHVLIDAIHRAPGLSALFFALALFLGWVLFRIRLVSRHNRQLRKEKKVMFGFIEDIGEAFTEGEQVEVRDLLDRVVYYALSTTASSAGLIYLIDAHQALRVEAQSGIFPPLFPIDDAELDGAASRVEYLERALREKEMRVGDTLIGEVAKSGKSCIIEFAEDDPRLPNHQADFLKIHSLIAVPMRFSSKVMGVLTVVNPTDGGRFSQGDLSLLQVLADQASVSAYYARLKDAILDKERLDRDLTLATNIQQAMLPGELPAFEHLEIAAYNNSARQVGGDYYDVLQVDDEHIGIAIADVSGKGIVGALVMAVCRSVLRAHAENNLSPVDVLLAVRKTIASDVPEDMFITMSYLVLNIHTLELKLARAGHEPLLHFQRETGTVVDVEPDGAALGLLDEALFTQVLTETTISLKSGDFFALYTDGVTEAMNAAGEEWGKNTLIEALQADKQEDVGGMLDAVKQRVLRFTGDMQQSDDMTMILVGVK